MMHAVFISEMYFQELLGSHFLEAYQRSFVFVFFFSVI